VPRLHADLIVRPAEYSQLVSLSFSIGSPTRYARTWQIDLRKIRAGAEPRKIVLRCPQSISDPLEALFTTQVIGLGGFTAPGRAPARVSSCGFNYPIGGSFLEGYSNTARRRTNHHTVPKRYCASCDAARALHDRKSNALSMAPNNS